MAMMTTMMAMTKSMIVWLSWRDNTHARARFHALHLHSRTHARRRNEIARRTELASDNAEWRFKTREMNDDDGGLITWRDGRAYPTLTWPHFTVWTTKLKPNGTERERTHTCVHKTVCILNTQSVQHDTATRHPPRQKLNSTVSIHPDAMNWSDVHMLLHTPWRFVEYAVQTYDARRCWRFVSVSVMDYYYL